jgi:hypothetical protein
MGDGVAQVGSKLAYLEVYYEQIPDGFLNGYQQYTTKTHRVLHVADMARSVAFAPMELPESLGAAPLQVVDGVVLTSRWVPSPVHQGKVRFFVDRVDLSGAAPVPLPSMNTPGSLVLLDGPSGRLATVDYRATHAQAADWQSCQNALGWRAQFDYDTRDCVSISRSFKLSDTSGTYVSLRQVLEPPSQNIGGVVSAEDRIYVTRYPQYQSDASNGGKYVPIEDGGLWAIGGIRDGEMSIVSQMKGDTNWPLAARGSKVAIYTADGLAIYDTTTPAPTVVSSAQLRGWGYTSQVLLGDDRAICSLGEWGLQTIRY